ncbi:MAG: hypothetical protein H0V17_10080 [Deltaproteobacteria bacterium]|nr:hypothetical protein [Deltaproteobacteria bacterium]
MRRCVVVGITLLTLYGVGAAPAHADCAKDAEELRTHLVTERGKARVWNITWGALFALATGVQLVAVAAEFNPLGEFDDAYEEQLYVGAIKATLGVGSKVVLPLKIQIPPVEADACVDVAALRKAVARAATKESQSIWLTIIGGTVVNLTGAIWLWARHDFKTAATSFATGVPVGPISALTQPRGSSKFYKRKRIEWVAGLGWIGGSF